jgi:rhodanese-related sulfurtransferase
MILNSNDIKNIVKMFQNEFDIDAKKAKEMLDTGEFILIDVRTNGEYLQGKLRDSILIDISSREFEDKINALDNNKKYIVYCRTGSRSGHAVRVMKQMGFTEVYNLQGGIMLWHMNGLPVDNL